MFYFGGVGAALTRVILSLGYVVFIPPIIHRKFPLFRNELKKWYLSDVGLPLLTVLVVVGFSYLVVPSALPTIPFLFVVASVTLLAFVAAVLSTRQIRNWAVEQLGILYKRAYPT